MSERTVRRICGAVLVGLSVISIVQSLRELHLWKIGAETYEDRRPSFHYPLTFAGHEFSVDDDQPVDSSRSRHKQPGRIQLTIDGRPLGEPSTAMIRTGGPGIERYFEWVDAWRFTARETGESMMLFVRRLAPVDDHGTRYEIHRVGEDGRVTTAVLRGWQLARDYPVYRATQFVRPHAWIAAPLSMIDAAAFPPLLLIFPFGTLVLGGVLLRQRQS